MTNNFQRRDERDGANAELKHFLNATNIYSGSIILCDSPSPYVLATRRSNSCDNGKIASLCRFKKE